MKILIVEDEPRVASFIKKGLEDSLYEAEIAYDGLSAEKLATIYKYDLFILDVIIPGISGLDLCRKLKKLHPDTPVLMLTALGTTDDKLIGFEAGANDYMVKPFEFRELLARVKVLIKPSQKSPESSGTLVFDDLELNLDTKMARRGEILIELTVKEFLLLEFFMKNTGRVLSRNEISEKVWEQNLEYGSNTVDAYVNFLRKKIDKDFDKKLIKTKIGFGYIFGDIKI
jgi:two-component system, OmpR family, copper resistance phosphate regulon response regulator CusR